MRKPIRFRAWSNEHNRYCDFVTLDEIGRWIGWIESSGVYLTTTDIILEQDTGLKDKNGEEIYEGSMVKSKNGQRYGFVEYMDNDGAFMIWWTSENEFIYLGEAIRKYEDLEVIGNIHEDKELLGGEE